jgi:toxin ParE1/3/4
MAEVRLSPAARRDLDAIYDFTAQTWGTPQARSYLSSIDQAFRLLAARPASGAPCDHIRPGYRSWRVARHRIYFRAAPDGITVVRVLHERMDIGSQFP